MLVYELSGVARDYAGRRVLDVGQLQVQPGEILGLVGPSGAGKSTLLRLLAFVEPPTSGQIKFKGEVVADPARVPPAVRRQVTMVFQRPLLLRRSVTDNVAYGLRLRNGRRDPAHVESALAQVGLADLARMPALRLSGGEMQRVALARALVVEPQVLLLDEPTANLDPYNVGLIESIVREQNSTHGRTFILVTHNVFQAKRLAHRVGLLLGGRLVELSPTREFFESPRDVRTAAFVRGDMVY